MSPDVQFAVDAPHPTIDVHAPREDRAAEPEVYLRNMLNSYIQKVERLAAISSKESNAAILLHLSSAQQHELANLNAKFVEATDHASQLKAESEFLRTWVTLVVNS